MFIIQLYLHFFFYKSNNTKTLFDIEITFLRTFSLKLILELCEGHTKPKFKDGCKIFVLDHCQGAGKVCLVYPKRKGDLKPNICKFT